MSINIVSVLATCERAMGAAKERYESPESADILVNVKGKRAVGKKYTLFKGGPAGVVVRQFTHTGQKKMFSVQVNASKLRDAILERMNDVRAEKHRQETEERKKAI